MITYTNVGTSKNILKMVVIGDASLCLVVLGVRIVEGVNIYIARGVHVNDILRYRWQHNLPQHLGKTEE